ncbi:MAG: response regulator [Elusimicrobia bacterium]|nr:response regulator [Elusimicrobiota bacterium]
MKVLIIDDSPIARNMLSDMLAVTGNEVAGETDDLDQALALYKSTKPDLVTLDLSMPKADGMTVLKALRALDPKARVLIISANAQDNLKQDLTAAGAAGFLGKPFSIAELLGAAQKASAK